MFGILHCVVDKFGYILDALMSFRVTIVTATLGFLILIYLVNFSDVPKNPNVAPAYIPNDITKSIAQQCEERYNLTKEDNLNVIRNYPRGVADRYMWKATGNRSTPAKMTPFPVIAIALSRQYYPQSMGLFFTIHKLLMANTHYSGQIKIVLYDLGLSQRQLKLLQEKCKCEIRKFPFRDFPFHVRILKTYAFKPIIIQKLLMEFGFVWWVDSSVRFTTNNVDDALNYAIDNSMLFTVSTDPIEDYTITRNTDVRTFQFLGEDRCKFRPFAESWATTILFHYDRVTKAVVNAWTACALNMNCIAPIGTDRKLTCNLKHRFDGRCHRFDQSVLSILTRRLFHEQNTYPIDVRLNDVYTIKRDHIVNYFEKCSGFRKRLCIT